jgi:hypothetical protein
MRPASHKGAARIYVTLHDLHDSKGTGTETKESLDEALRLPTNFRLRFGSWDFFGHWSLVIGHFALATVLGHWEFRTVHWGI